VRIESVERRASGTAKIAVGGSSFLCRERYLGPLGLDSALLEKGRELDEEAMEALGLAAEATEAELRGAGLLARAEQSRFLLAAKLEKRELDGRAVRLALDFLEAEGLLSDSRFAEAWLRSQLGKTGSSPAKLGAGLRARGIDEEVAKKALAAAFGPQERRLLLRAALAKEEKRLKAKLGRDARPSTLRSMLRSRLRGLGFGSGEVEAFFEDEEEGA
jgi:regulatory protein